MEAKIINDHTFKSFELVLKIESKDELNTLHAIFGMLGFVCNKLNDYSDRRVTDNAWKPFNNANIYELLCNKM